MILDDFVSKISTMLLSLIEGEKDIDILSKMAFSLSIEDIIDRITNVYGVFLNTLKIYPVEKLQAGEDPETMALAILSKRNEFRALDNVSIYKINQRMTPEIFTGNV